MGGKPIRFTPASIIAILAIVAIAVAVWLRLPGRNAEAGQLSQFDIEAKAIAYAQARGFQGPLSSIESKQITFAEFNARLDPFSHDLTPGDTLYWIVILKGKASIPGPGMNGQAYDAQYDNMWVLLTTHGDIRATGTQAPGNALDLSKPPTPITSWPTPAGTK